jgi:hypothetical protein
MRARAASDSSSTIDEVAGKARGLTAHPDRIH